MFKEHINTINTVEPFLLVVATAGESYSPAKHSPIGEEEQ